MKNMLLGSVLLGTSLFFTGCGDLDQPKNEVVENATVVVDLDGATIRQSLIAAEMPGVDESTTVYGYKAYKIPYATTDDNGNTVQVSGLMVVPTGVPEVVSTLGFSVVSDSHDTRFAEYEIPTTIAAATNMPDGTPIIFSSLYAFVTLQPDYIGFGDSKDEVHPFVLKKSLANASVDFIEAAQAFASDNSINLNGQLFLTGYSEGGHAAMAALQKIEQEGELQVTLAAPAAGPYDLHTIGQAVLSQPALGRPSFMAAVACAYTYTYGHDKTDLINEPYASTLPTLFNGGYNSVQIDAALTTVTTGPDGLFNPLGLNSFFTDSNDWFKNALIANSVHAWAPQTPVRLIHCQGDDVIPYAISQLTEATMEGMGAADVDIVPVEAVMGLPYEVDHVDCGALAYGVAANMFAQTRAATIGY